MARLAAAAAFVVMLALRWLAALLFSTDRSGDLPIAPGGSAGRTVLAAGALTDAVAGEIEATAAWTPPGPASWGPADPELVVTATLEETADLAALASASKPRP